MTKSKKTVYSFDDLKKIEGGVPIECEFENSGELLQQGGQSWIPTIEIHWSEKSIYLSARHGRYFTEPEQNGLSTLIDFKEVVADLVAQRIMEGWTDDTVIEEVGIERVRAALVVLEDSESPLSEAQKEKVMTLLVPHQYIQSYKDHQKLFTVVEWMALDSNIQEARAMRDFALNRTV